jgi:DNA-binding MarR family transcriptional regulator
MSSKQAAHDATLGKLYSRILENKSKKKPRELERTMRGVSNHRRIQILAYLAKHKDATMEQLSEALDCNFKTISGHTQKLVHAGLIEKKYLGLSVLHSLTRQGSKVQSFLSSF